MAEVYFAIPGDLATLTGGYGYDRRVLALLPERGLDVRYLQLPGSYPFASVPELGEAGYKLRNTPEDAVLLIDGLAYRGADRLVLKDIDRRIVALVHHPSALEAGLSDRRRRALHYSEQTALARASHVIVTSATTAGILVADYDVPSGKITVAEPGTDPAPRAVGSGRRRPDARRRHDFPAKGISRAGGGARSLPSRGLASAPSSARSTARLRRPLPLTALVKARGLGDRIAFDGRTRATPRSRRRSASADVFVMPSLFEGYGMVLGEAMARGLPIVCTTGGAAAQTVPDQAALKVPPGDASALREAITRVLADAGLRARLSDASWSAGQTLPRWEQTADRIADGSPSGDEWSIGMSGFSAEWLALREPADHRARNPGLLGAVARHFGDRDDVRCGRSRLRSRVEPARHGGSASRAAELAAGRLRSAPPRCRPRAACRLGSRSEVLENGISLALGHRHLEITFIEADLSKGLDLLLDPAPDLITAAALFDLVSPEWITQFAASLANRRVPLYTALTYDGVENWSPPHEMDQAVFAAFHVHQATDKGFGASAGPQATELLVRAFESHGYTVRTARSPWRLGPADRALMNELAAGIASAAAETGRISPAQAQVWLDARRQAAAAEIGHLDLLALPPG